MGALESMEIQDANIRINPFVLVSNVNPTKTPDNPQYLIESILIGD
jgi:hypothetical protein